MMSPPGHPGATASHAPLGGSICAVHCLAQPGINSLYLYTVLAKYGAPEAPSAPLHPCAGS